MPKGNWLWKRKVNMPRWSRSEMVTQSTEQASSIQSHLPCIQRKSSLQSMKLRQSQETVSERLLQWETSKMEMSREEQEMNGWLLVQGLMCLELKRVWVRLLDQRSLKRIQLWGSEQNEPVRIIKVIQERTERNGWSETLASIFLRSMKKLSMRILSEEWS